MECTEEKVYPWVVCIASFVYLSIQSGIVLSSGIYYIIFNEAFNTSTQAVALLPSLHFACLCAIGPVAGLMVQRFGERPTAFFGTILAASGLVSSAFTTQVYQLYITFSIANGCGLGIGYNPCLTILDKYFVKHRNLALGIVSCGTGIGSFIFPSMITALNEHYGWRGALLILGGVNLNSLVLFALFRPKKLKASKALDDVVPEALEDSSPSDVVMVEGQQNQSKMCKSFSALWKFSYICQIFANLVFQFSYMMLFTHLGAFILSLGFPKEHVVRIYVVIGIVVTITRPLAGALSQVKCIDVFIYVAVGNIMCGVVTVILPSMQSLPFIYTYGVVQTCFYAPFGTLYYALVGESIPKALVPSAFGILTLLSVPGLTAGPPLAAWLYQTTGHYSHTFYLAGILFFLSGLFLTAASPWCHRKSKCCKTTRSSESAIPT